MATWKQVKDIIDKKIEEQNIDPDTDLWFIDIHEPLISESDIDVSVDELGLWIVT